MVRTDARVQGQSREKAPPLSTHEILDKIAHASFAVLSHVTTAGAPRSSGVVYTVAGGRLFVAVAPDSWKARQVAADPRGNASFSRFSRPATT